MTVEVQEYPSFEEQNLVRQIQVEKVNGKSPLTIWRQFYDML